MFLLLQSFRLGSFLVATLLFAADVSPGHVVFQFYLIRSTNLPFTLLFSSPNLEGFSRGVEAGI